MAATPLERVRRWRETVRSDLFGSVLPFWLRHSVDLCACVHKCDCGGPGGFFNCLDEYGAVYDTTKHVWLQGRQCWMFARIANTYSDAELAAAFRDASAATLSDIGAPTATPPPGTLVAVQPQPLTRASLIRSARAGVEFLRKHAVRGDGTVYFALSREGMPVAMQRKPFSATFMIMALNEVGKATGERHLRDEAVALLERVLAWIRTPGALGREPLPGAQSLFPLNVPMILLSVINELQATAEPDTDLLFEEEREWAVSEILKHRVAAAAERADAARRMCLPATPPNLVLENVRDDGAPAWDTIDGRLVNPGHAIEAGWFLLDDARRSASKSSAAKQVHDALDIITHNFEYGWDVAEGGGIIYFRDACGFTPSQLEWNMKLWWPINESMIAFAMAYAETLDERYLNRFELVAERAYSHLADAKHGEWFGYADRAGAVTHRFKGGPYKGCFHVPRSLFLCELLLREAEMKLEESK